MKNLSDKTDARPIFLPLPGEEVSLTLNGTYTVNISANDAYGLALNNEGRVKEELLGAAMAADIYHEQLNSL